TRPRGSGGRRRGFSARLASRRAAATEAAIEIRANNHAAAGVRHPAKVGDETLITALSIEVELYVRRVERRQGLPFLAKHAANSSQRGWSAQVADDRNNPIALLH